MMGIAAGGSAQSQHPLSLTTVVNADDILASGVLNDADVLSALAPLLATSSEGSEAELVETLRSPQLRQALGSLTAALQVRAYTVLRSDVSLVAIVHTACSHRVLHLFNERCCSALMYIQTPIFNTL
jgi:UCH-binding domain